MIVKKRYLLITIPIIVLAVIYIFQRFNFANTLNHILPASMEISHPYVSFVINKTARLILNDLACMWLIYLLFQHKIFLRGAFYLFLAELFVLLPIYFFLKLSLEGDSELSSPLLSQIHRLIVNPLLMFLLIVGFIYQRLKVEKS